jgi:hypothetical protein
MAVPTTASGDLNTDDNSINAAAMTRRLHEFIKQFVGAGDSLTPTTQANVFYAHHVDYFDQGSVDRTEIARSISDYHSRFQSYSQQLKAEPFVIETADNEWDVQFSLLFSATGTSGKVYEGTTDIHATVISDAGKFFITRIDANKRVLDKRSPDFVDRVRTAPARADRLPESAQSKRGANEEPRNNRRPDARSQFVSTRELKSLAGRNISDIWFSGDFVASRISGNTVVMYPVWSGGFVRGYSTEIRATFVNGVPNFPGRNRLPMDPMDSSVGIQIGKAEPARVISVTNGEKGKVIVRAEVNY